MNGRGYDYDLGRFLSVDPVIQSPGNSQSLNPYSYIMNNPLSGTDPTGYTSEGENKSETHEKDVLFATERVGSRLPSYTTVTVSVDSNGNVTGASGGSSDQRSAAKDYVQGHLDGAKSSAGSGYGAQASRGNVESPGNSDGGRGSSVPGQPAQQGSGDSSPPQMSPNILTDPIGAVFSDFGMEPPPLSPVPKADGHLSQVSIADWLAPPLKAMRAAGPVSRLFNKVFGKFFGSKAALHVPGRVQSRINLMNKGWEHVLDRHFNPSKNASQFTISPNDLRSLLQSKDVVGTKVTRILNSNDGARFVREVRLKQNIGLDKFNDMKPTSTMSVLTDKFGNLVTATPGVIR